MLHPYRQKVMRLERINMTILVIGFILTVVGSILGGTMYHWVLSLIIVFAYFMIASISYYVFKTLQNRSLRQSHFLLAMFCRAENNRYYLSRSVEMRPGFLASWLEFLVHYPQEEEDTAQDDLKWLLLKI